RAIFTEYAGEILKRAGDGLTLIELGAGTANKTKVIIAALLRRQMSATFYPIDVSMSALQIAQNELNAEFPALKVRPLVDNDSEGVTARFNLNVLSRINRELGADFDITSFRHIAVWNAQASRIEMHLESLRAQTVSIRDLDMKVRFCLGETIHTENSYKFTQ